MQQADSVNQSNFSLWDLDAYVVTWKNICDFM